MEPFTAGEVSVAIKSTALMSAAGPDGITLDQRRKIPPSIIAHIFNNWLTLERIPEEMKMAKTVFIPNCQGAAAATDFRLITISPMIYRIFSRDLLRRFSEGHSFHPFQSGFGDDRQALSSLILLQRIF